MNRLINIDALLSDPHMSNFEELFGINPHEFFSEHWEKNCVFLRKKFNQHLFFPNSDPRSLLQIAYQNSLVGSNTAVIMNGMKCDPVVYMREQTVILEKIQKLYEEGATVYLKDISSISAEFGEALNKVQVEIEPLALQVNMFVTPPRSVGLEAHFDMHDILVVQVSGKKRWKLWKAILNKLDDVELPFMFSGEVKAHVQANKPDICIETRPGDIMYIPRGVIHAPSTGNDASVHLAIWLLSPLLNQSGLIIDEEHFRKKNEPLYKF